MDSDRRSMIGVRICSPDAWVQDGGVAGDSGGGNSVGVDVDGGILYRKDQVRELVPIFVGCYCSNM